MIHFFPQHFQMLKVLETSSTLCLQLMSGCEMDLVIHLALFSLSCVSLFGIIVFLKKNAVRSSSDSCQECPYEFPHSFFFNFMKTDGTICWKTTPHHDSHFQSSLFFWVKKKVVSRDIYRCQRIFLNVSVH